MTLRDSLDLLLFFSVCLFLMAGYPVAFTLGGTALMFAGIAWSLGVFDLSFIEALIFRIFGTMTNPVLVAVPLFIFMGVMLERSRVAENLLEGMGRLFGRVPGGMGFSITVVGALLAASTGIVGATVVTMGLLTLPTMLRRGYDPPFICGSICAAGTLGQIIPPSIILVLLGDLLGSAYQKAQLEKGVFAPDTVTVGDLFAGALIPGLILAGLYLLYQIAIAVFQPHKTPAIPQADLDADKRPIWRVLVQALLPPVALIVAVLGSIMGGIATPTEAAAIGALGAILLAGVNLAPARSWPIQLAVIAFFALFVMRRYLDLRLGRDGLTVDLSLAKLAALGLTAAMLAGVLVAVWRTWASGVLVPVLRSTARMTSMVFVILIGAALFSLVFRGLGGDDAVKALLTGMPGGAFGAMFAVMAVMFLLGFLLDFIEIIYVVVPVVAPVLFALGMDPIWVGVMMGVVLQTSFLTPPFGFALFYLRGVAPPQITTGQIYRGIVPFVLLQLVGLGIVWAMPTLATWLPARLFD